MSFDEQPDPLSDALEQYDRLKKKYSALESENLVLRENLRLAVDILARGEIPPSPKPGHVHHPDANCDGDCVDWERFQDMIQGMRNALKS